ncbi:hypothetical protein quinque_011259 [Culex quinquefasciatus]|uniref:uncharacterized protein LOC119766838 n=1 Tax=Culex quinquefasciatus TaxID=7176 RepID=UPI0018E30501|nr:uncharacterized protein LOC119766838 [Culex quinquefasciatus]
MKWFSLATLLVVICAMNTVSGQAPPTIGDLITQLTSLVGKSLPFFAQFLGQLSMPVLDPAQDYTSLDAINKQLTQLVSTFQKFSPYLVWIVQPGNAKTPPEKTFAEAVTAFANVLPQLNQMMTLILTNIQSGNMSG